MTCLSGFKYAHSPESGDETAHGPGREAGSLKSGLRNVFLLVRCSQKSHDDCRNIRDALIDGTSGYIQRAYTTDALIDDKRYCVAASALVPVEEAGKFKRDILKIQTKERRPVTVNRCHLIVDDRDDG